MTDFIVSVTLLVPEKQRQLVRDLFLDKLRRIAPKLQARGAPADEGIKLICRVTAESPESGRDKVLYWCEKAAKLERRLTWRRPEEENITVAPAGDLDDLIVDTVEKVVDEGPDGEDVMPGDTANRPSPERVGTDG